MSHGVFSHKIAKATFITTCQCTKGGVIAICGHWCKLSADGGAVGLQWWQNNCTRDVDYFTCALDTLFIATLLWVIIM